jgi:hypothetical protein
MHRSLFRISQSVAGNCRAPIPRFRRVGSRSRLQEFPILLSCRSNFYPATKKIEATIEKTGLFVSFTPRSTGTSGESPVSPSFF